MLISLNGKEHETAADTTTVAQLVEQLGLRGPLAVELNQRVCRKQDHHDTILQAGDIVEIVTIVGGG